MAPLPSFELLDRQGRRRGFPARRAALVCFLKEDCPTCALSAPIVRAAQAAPGDRLDVWAIAQDEDGGEAMALRFDLAGPVLDDSALRVSHAYDLDTVPTVILT